MKGAPTAMETELVELIADLAVVFKHHFHLKPTVLGPSGQPSTPFVAFVIAACAEHELRFTAAQISDAGRRCGIPEDR